MKKLVDSSVETVDLVEKTARAYNLELVENPGNVLKKYILDEELSGDEAKLMVAQGLIYILKKEELELLPTDEYPCPTF